VPELSRSVEHGEARKGLVPEAGVELGLGVGRLAEAGRVPVVWGFAYAVMAWTMGVVYSSEYCWAAVWILVGAVAALGLPEYAGFLLGPTMGLGLLVPGWVSVRRVRAQARSAPGDAL
jgi:hypothetical protein